MVGNQQARHSVVQLTKNVVTDATGVDQVNTSITGCTKPVIGWAPVSDKKEFIVFMTLHFLQFKLAVAWVKCI